MYQYRFPCVTASPGYLVTNYMTPRRVSCWGSLTPDNTSSSTSLPSSPRTPVMSWPSPILASPTSAILKRYNSEDCTTPVGLQPIAEDSEASPVSTYARPKMVRRSLQLSTPQVCDTEDFQTPMTSLPRDRTPMAPMKTPQRPVSATSQTPSSWTSPTVLSPLTTLVKRHYENALNDSTRSSLETSMDKKPGALRSGKARRYLTFDKS